MSVTILMEGTHAQVLARCVALLKEMGAQEIAVQASEGIITARSVGGRKARTGPVTLRIATVDAAQRVEVEGRGAVEVMEVLGRTG